MKNLLITGGCGFIGSNFINYIYNSNSNINIINIDAMYYCASENNIIEEIRNSNRYKLEKGNLCSFNFVKNVIENNKIAKIYGNTSTYNQNTLPSIVFDNSNNTLDTLEYFDY